MTAIVGLFLLLLPWLGLLGPDKLRDYLYRQLAYKVIVKNIVTESRDTDSDKVLKIMEWVHKTNYPLDAFGLIDMSAFDDFVRGIGYCDQSASGVINLAGKAGFSGRVTGLYGDHSISRHSIAEVNVNNRHVVIDPLYNVTYKNNHGELATFNDFQTNATAKIIHSVRYNGDYPDNSDYHRMFTPKHPPKILSTSDRNAFKDLLSRLLAYYYDSFGDHFLKLYEKVYFARDNSDRFLIARYKHLTFRFDEAINEYTVLINSSSGNVSDSPLFTRFPFPETILYFRAKAYRDNYEWINCRLNFTALLTKRHLYSGMIVVKRRTCRFWSIKIL